MALLLRRQLQRPRVLPRIVRACLRNLDEFPRVVGLFEWRIQHAAIAEQAELTRRLPPDAACLKARRGLRDPYLAKLPADPVYKLGVNLECLINTLDVAELVGLVALRRFAGPMTTVGTSLNPGTRAEASVK
jgi:hypothetical protein